MMLKRLTDTGFRSMLHTKEKVFFDCMQCSRLDKHCEKGDCTEMTEKAIERLGVIEDILGDDYDLEALRLLVRSYKHGLLLPLPCHVGHPVYIIGGKVRRGVFEKWCNNGEFRLSDIEKFGKTVFLTPEEATAAMEKLTEDMLYE